MNLQTYEKTRYQNIYRHKKNKNYVIMISKPVKSSISSVDDHKILTIEEALRVRDNPKLRQQRGAINKINTDGRYEFDVLWEKYIYDCKYVRKLAYNTVSKKIKNYNKYFKNKINQKLSKTTKEFWGVFIDRLQCSKKQKNCNITLLKAFFNWCTNDDNKYIIKNPVNGLKKYQVPKPKMKFWTPEELKTFLSFVEEDLKSNDIVVKKKAYLVKILTIIGFSLGDRFGESRALSFNFFSKKDSIVTIAHSINYDTKSNDFVGSTKNYQSQREIDVPISLIEEVYKYKDFLKYELGYDVKNDSLIFFNYTTNRPYSDTNLRKHFYYYCDKSNVTRIRVYDLRHTYVATMMSEGLELYHISERLGHINYSTTVNKYGHLSNQKRKEIAQITDKYI